MPTCSEARSNLLSLLRGVEHFNTEVFPAKEALFASLAKGQAPGALFIDWADCRIHPNLITQTDRVICSFGGTLAIGVPLMGKCLVVFPQPLNTRSWGLECLPLLSAAIPTVAP